MPSEGQNHLWLGDLIWLHAVAGSLIAASLFSIPLTMLYIMRKRREVPFPLIYRLFILSILACGSVHLLEVWNIWHAQPWASASLKLLAAGTSIATAFALLRAIPQALALPSPDDLIRLTDSLQERARIRTADLVAANTRLTDEIRHRELAEAEVRRLNQSLQHRLDEVQTLVDLLPVGIAIAEDPHCHRIRTNGKFADMLGLARDANASLTAPPDVPRPTFKIFHNRRELRPDELPMQYAARENTSVTDYEETILRDDGRELRVVVNAVPLRDADGDARGCVAVFADVTSHRQAEDKRLEFERGLLETQKLESLGVLAGGIAHDFNNLLTGILGNSSLARTQLPPSHRDVHTALASIEETALRAADLCKQMLAYAGKGRFVVQPLDLGDLLDDTAHLLEISINKKVTLRLLPATALPSFQGDAAQIRQALMNLVVNASEAIGDRPGIISVETGAIRVNRELLSRRSFHGDIAEGDCVYIEIRDTGCGMDSPTISRIFDPFFSTKFTGRGLGLAAVLGIVRSHKGAIKVFSEPGRGSAFTLLFPAAAPSTAPRPTDTPAPSGALLNATILAIDDEETVRAVATRILTSVGCEVVEASDGFEALEIFQHGGRHFDLVLMDLTMPRMDGEETFRQLRRIDPSVRVVLMSGYNEQDATDRFDGEGIAGFVAKPFDLDSLLAKVRAALKP